MFKSKPRLTLLLILILSAASVLVDIPKEIPVKYSWKNYKIDTKIVRPDWRLPFWKPNLDLKTGLDIRGGSHVVFEADVSGVPSTDVESALTATKYTIERRVNLLGVSEASVQTAAVNNQHRLIVELPGVTDISEAVGLIGKTAQLEFRKPAESTTSAEPFEKTDLTGKDLIRAGVAFDRSTGKPTVTLQFNADGTQKFAKLTTELVGKQIAIYLDNKVVSAPVVNTAITTGEANITGSFSLDEAKQLAIQLNSGALPLPIKQISQETVGATLGQEAVTKSVQAGLIGLALVMIFMAAYYGKLGLWADVGLIVYGLITLALYKLFAITLTLPGIAGFILSVGMAVDANILIFERLKEELRLKRPQKLAIELAFGRAWDSIRDANVCTLIACFVLFNPFNWGFLNTSGSVRGFALTLALGIAISLFTGIIVTRSLIRVFYIEKRKSVIK